MDNTWNNAQRNTQGNCAGSRQSGYRSGRQGSRTEQNTGQTGNVTLDATAQAVNETVTIPAVDESDDFVDSLRQILADNLGQPVNIEFLIGANGQTARSGILYSVGPEYCVLFDRGQGRYTLCDLNAVRFVTFHSSCEH